MGKNLRAEIEIVRIYFVNGEDLMESRYVGEPNLFVVCLDLILLNIYCLITLAVSHVRHSKSLFSTKPIR